MDTEAHCKECSEKLGETFRYVHRWLDWFALGKDGYNPEHRKYRHHRKGIEIVRMLWGNRAARAAELHIMADWNGRIPKKSDYSKAEEL